MAERGASVADLEQRLTDLGRRLAYPATPDLSNMVRQHLRTQPRRVPFWSIVLQRRPVLAALVALVVLAILAGGLLAIGPDARAALADRLGLRGVQITQVSTIPTPSTARLDLGSRLTLEEVRSRVGFEVKLPARLGAPDEVYFSSVPAGGQVALVYAARPDLPATRTTGVGLLFTEFQASLLLGGPITKGVPPGTSIQEVSVNGSRGYWIEGDPHIFFYQDPRGRMQSENTRLAANVLLWEDGPLTLRMEGTLSRDAALEIARSVN